MIEIGVNMKMSGVLIGLGPDKAHATSSMLARVMEVVQEMEAEGWTWTWCSLLQEEEYYPSLLRGPVKGYGVGLRFEK